MKHVSLSFRVGLVIVFLSLMGSSCPFTLQPGLLTVNVAGDGKVLVVYDDQTVQVTEDTQFIKVITPGTTVTLTAVPANDLFTGWQVTDETGTGPRSENPLTVTTGQQPIAVNATFD